MAATTHLTADAPRPAAAFGGWSARLQRVVLRYGLIVVLIAVWQAASAFGLIDPLFFSSPAGVVEAAIPWYTSGRIWPHFLATTGAILVGLGAATVFGLIGGILLGRYATVSSLFNPLLTIAYAIPVVAFGPSLSLLFGASRTVPILLIFGMAIFPILFTVAAGIRTARKDLVRMARHFGASERQIVVDILIPTAMPYLVGALRVSIGRAIGGAVVGEWLSSTTGLGALIFSSAAVFETKTTYMAGLTLVCLSLLLSALVRRLDEWFHRWRVS